MSDERPDVSLRHMVCPECGQTGNESYCLHWDMAGERKVRTAPRAALDQRVSIAWCGRCGNVSVDGINFTRVEGGLQCAGCGAVSPHFEYIRKSAVPLDAEVPEP